METLFYDLNNVTIRRVVHRCDRCTLLSLFMTLFLRLTLFFRWNWYDHTRAHLPLSRDHRVSLKACWDCYDHTRAQLARGVLVVDRVKKPVTWRKPYFTISSMLLLRVWSSDVTAVALIGSTTSGCAWCFQAKTQNDIWQHSQVRVSSKSQCS